MKPLSVAVENLDWAKGDGLLPAVVQHADEGTVLMVGFMNAAALGETVARGRVVFWSRTKQRLWEKGETSGNTLHVVSIEADCDHDSLLVRARPAGPVCHRDTATCFGDGSGDGAPIAFLARLEEVIEQRITDRPEDSYTAKLFARGVKRMAQKVGEEGVEVALAATAGDDRELVSESADLLYHLTLLLKARGLSLADVATELAARHRAPR
jgi:phosphoribosyl-ATP pyrophosphohydrolase/phosphoribosyl-AMP cyclohydrolase